MKKIASATLARPQARERLSTIELIELELPASGRVDAPRHVVTLRQDGGESSLTATPCTRAEAERRAIDFLRRRLAAGDRLVRREGFEALELPEPAPQPVAAPVEATPAAVPPAVAALVAGFEPARWKLEPPSRRARHAWRVAERSDPEAGGAAQRALRGLVPRLVELLETGDDLLDLCLAVAIGRLGDAGAAEAMQVLAQRGRTPASRRAARQAWLMLLAPDARAAQVATLLPGWSAELASEASGFALVEEIERLRIARRAEWAPLLQDWYDRAFAQPLTRATLLRLLAALPLEAECFQGVRYVYKAAEMRRDDELLGLLHARFENTPSASGAPILPVPHGERGRLPMRAYRSATRDYLRLRGLRSLRRLAAIEHSRAPGLAVALLLGLDDAELPEARQEWRYDQHGRRLRRYHPAAGWMLVARLLLPEHPGLQTSTRAKRWWTLEPLDTSVAMDRRTDGLRGMWDAHPEALLRLALESRSALVHAVVARALQDHAAFVQAQDVPVHRALLRSPYAPTAAAGFAAARSRVEACIDLAGQVPWLELMATGSHPGARDYALLRLAGDPLGFAQHVGLVVALLLAADEGPRRQGLGLALLAPAPALLAEIAGALLAADPSAPGLAEGAAQIEQMLGGPLAAAAARVAGDALALLDHPAVAVVQVGVAWLLAQDGGIALLPPAQLGRLLGADDPQRRACGVRLLAALPDELLLGQAELVCSFAVHPHAGIRAAVGPALLRLAAADAGFAALAAERLHEVLFMGESAEGVHDDALRWLTADLASHAPARDPSGAWRALQAKSPGAQRYGAWALAALQPADFSLRQQATLARHADVGVRGWAMRAIDATLPTTPVPAQSAQLLPLAETAFDDARAFAQQLFGERLADESLDVELLIAWVDHPQPWMQALGRSRLVRRMSAADASLCLTRLSQHPGTQVQLFVTQWLLELPTDDPARLAQRLRELTPYFLTVLSQVHRGRVAKTRVTAFLREQVACAETAAVVAEIFARQVVSASLGDKPQYIAGLRDIAARHPQIELPFLAWKTPDAHTA